MLFALLGSLTTDAIAQPLPTALVSVGPTLYRVNGVGLPAGTVQTYPTQPGSIIGMTIVPPGVSFAGCIEGNVIAVENAFGGRVWRVDGARVGTPRLVQVGRLPAGTIASSIAFAHGRFFGITGDCPDTTCFREFSTTTLEQIGPTVTLLTGTSGVGGLAFDGVGTWYVTNGDTNRLIHLPDPPTMAGWMFFPPDVGIDFAANGLEMYAGNLWGGLLRPNGTMSRVLIGTFNLQTGFVSQVWEVPQVVDDVLGFVAFTPSCIDIAAQPQRAFVCPDGTAVFSTTAAGPGPFAYQWRKGGIPIDPALNPSAASSGLAIFGVQPSDFGTYDCIVANACGTVRCNPALLTGRLGDADGDGAVGLSDIALMIQNWSDPGEPPVPPGMLGDLTGDGLVQLDDVAIATLNWGQSCD